jgi:hypothetical protein
MRKPRQRSCAPASQAARSRRRPDQLNLDPLSDERNNPVLAGVDHVFELYLPRLPRLRPAPHVCQYRVEAMRDLPVRQVGSVPLHVGIEGSSDQLAFVAQERFPHPTDYRNVSLRHSA